MRESCDMESSDDDRTERPDAVTLASDVSGLDLNKLCGPDAIPARGMSRPPPCACSLSALRPVPETRTQGLRPRVPIPLFAPVRGSALPASAHQPLARLKLESQKALELALNQRDDLSARGAHAVLVILNLIDPPTPVHGAPIRPR